MSEFQSKIETLLERNKLNAEKNKFESPRTPVGRTGRLDHAFVEGVIKTTVVYEFDKDGNMIPDGQGGYLIDYAASNAEREKKYDIYDKATSAPTSLDLWARDREAKLRASGRQ